LPLAELNDLRRLGAASGDGWRKLLDLDLDLRSDSLEGDLLRRREFDALVEMVDTESTDGDLPPARRASASRIKASSRSSSSLFFALSASRFASSASTMLFLEGG
jgi:hypothetical protein